MRSNRSEGWSITRRILQVVTGLLTIYAFIEGYRRPHFIFEQIDDEATFLMRLASGLFVAFLPGVLFGLTFVGTWSFARRESTLR